jgi:hypothetical protein
MPILRMTARERAFCGVVNETSSSAPATVNAWRALASAASVA